MGTVAYIGPCHLGDGVWIGVQLQERREDAHNGTVSLEAKCALGKRQREEGEEAMVLLLSARLQVDEKHYFKCKPGYGLLRPATKVHWHGKRVSEILQGPR
jgi:CAP-Gly domain-containing linker protein 3/4